MDTFTENWSRFNLAYIFPNRVMVELIFNRIYHCSRESRFIVIYTWKLRALWFPKLIKLSIQHPLRILSTWSTVTDLAESGQVPSSPTGGKIPFTSWMLSGRDDQKLENCPGGLSKLGAELVQKKNQQS